MTATKIWDYLKSKMLFRRLINGKKGNGITAPSIIESKLHALEENSNKNLIKARKDRCEANEPLDRSTSFDELPHSAKPAAR